MEYYIKERKFDDETAKTAWSKAREDAEQICQSMGFQPITIWPESRDRVHASKLNKLLMNLQTGRLWEEKLSVLRPGDTLVIQLPAINNCLFLNSVLKKLPPDVRVIGLIHDLEVLRMSIDRKLGLSSRLRIRLEEISVLRQCHRLIVHNRKMADFLADQGFDRKNMVELEIFDYLLPGQSPQTDPDPHRLMVAGNLHPDKAGYLYDLPVDVPVNLYGVYYRDTGTPNHHYRGSFTPEELPHKLQGGFGLIWDGPSAQTCSGTYGEYLRYNNPHKASLYLASGFPVVIWEEAALAPFLRSQNAAITAASVAQAAELIAAVSPEEYGRLCKNARTVGAALRDGFYLKKALSRAMQD